MNMRHAIIAIAVGALTLISQIVLSDDDHHERRRGNSSSERPVDVGPVTNAAYAKECGQCHFAYPPGLLPERSWRKIMNNLNSHFGDNAELPPNDRDQIMSYLVGNSAEHGNYRRSEKIIKTVGASDVPMRITDLSYFRNKHSEVPDRLIKGNKQVGTLANCSACHTRAGEGSFSEHEVKIPGGGRWEND